MRKSKTTATVLVLLFFMFSLGAFGCALAYMLGVKVCGWIAIACLALAIVTHLVHKQVRKRDDEPSLMERVLALQQERMESER